MLFVFHFWLIIAMPKPNSISLSYRETGGPTWISINTGTDQLQLDVDTEYEFQCIVSDVFPVTDVDGSGGPTLGVCPGLTSVERDVVNVDFHYDGTHVAGLAGSDEGAMWDAASQTFDLTDTYTYTYTYTVQATDACPAKLTCSVDYFPASIADIAPLETNVPNQSVDITRISKYSLSCQRFTDVVTRHCFIDSSHPLFAMFSD